MQHKWADMNGLQSLLEEKTHTAGTMWGSWTQMNVNIKIKIRYKEVEWILMT
jgi:hypothetical protein